MFITRALALVLAATTAFAAAEAPVAAKAPEAEVEDLRQLTVDTFTASTAHGAWLVEHFSPRCGHCRAFAPTWAKVAKEKEGLERLAGFHMAQVNCLAQGDLCNTNNIKAYPQIMLYIDGKEVTEYKQDRNYDFLVKWIDDESDKYYKSRMAERGEVASPLNKRPNPDGVIAELNEKTYDELKAQGPMLVEFFAPWCTHCKKLRPIYETLATEMRGKINIAAVDCVANSAFCRGHGIAGFPTIRLIDGEASTDYAAARTLAKMSAFLTDKMKAATIQQIASSDELEEIVKHENQFFLYLTNFDTTAEEKAQVESTLKPFMYSIPTYTASDPVIYEGLNVANPPPTSVLVAFSGHNLKPEGMFPLPAADDQLRRFINSHRFPTLVDLNPGNFKEVMQSPEHALVVLGAIHTDGRELQERDTLLKIARAWKKGGRPFTQPVWFAAVDGEKWRGWMKRTLGIRPADMPTLVVIDTEMQEYYDITIEGHRAKFNGIDAFSVLEGVYQHFLKPKKIESMMAYGSRSATLMMMDLGQWSSENPVKSMFALIAAVAIFVLLLSRCVARDLSNRGGYMNEKGVHRPNDQRLD